MFLIQSSHNWDRVENPPVCAVLHLPVCLLLLVTDIHLSFPPALSAPPCLCVNISLVVSLLSLIWYRADSGLFGHCYSSGFKHALIHAIHKNIKYMHTHSVSSSSLFRQGLDNPAAVSPLTLLIMHGHDAVCVCVCSQFESAHCWDERHWDTKEETEQLFSIFLVSFLYHIKYLCLLPSSFSPVFLFDLFSFSP